MTLIITEWDNRGTQEVPFGFIYFNDGSRIGYAEGTGMFFSPDLNAPHRQMALDLLRKHFPDKEWK